MHVSNSALRQPERTVISALGLWLFVALLISISGVAYGVPAPVVGGTITSLTIFTLLALFFLRPLRAWAISVPLRWLVLSHAVRIIAGIGFLVLGARGAFPADFALVAGWGDILVGLATMAVAGMALPIIDRGRWWVVLVWDTLGLIDMLRVLSSALRLGFTHFKQVVAITAFPMSVLPTCIVPLVLVTHVLIFVRLWMTQSWRSVQQ